MSLPVLAVLTFGMPESGPEKTGTNEKAVPAQQDVRADLASAGNQDYHAFAGKCSTPARPLFRPGYGNR